MIAQGRRHATSYALSLKDSSLSVAINGNHIVVSDRAGPDSVARQAAPAPQPE
jgi:hypothetical protein